eukprot:12251822-Ditylum_brightwellii.AAC.1
MLERAMLDELVLEGSSEDKCGAFPVEQSTEMVEAVDSSTDEERAITEEEFEAKQSHMSKEIGRHMLTGWILLDAS